MNFIHDDYCWVVIDGIRNQSIRLLVLLLLFLPLPIAFADTDVNIGVRAHMGASDATARWQATADYLSRKIAGFRFHIVPYETIVNMEQAVAQGVVRFVITQPVAYVDLEVLYGASRLLTLVKPGNLTQFSSVIITRADNPSIHTINDLKGKSFGAVEHKGFGGWLMAKRELLKQGVDPDRDFSGLYFLVFQQNVVNAVLDHRVDAGTVRTGILEKLASQGLIKTEDLRILNAKTRPGFPYVFSTALYPEWVLAKTSAASEALAESLTQTLLSMPNDANAAKMGHYMAWTVSQDYSSVHQLMRQLKVGSYADYRQFDLIDVLEKYIYWILGVMGLLLIHIFYAFKIQYLNAALKHEIDEKNALIVRINTLATHDSLTGLANRKMVFELLTKSIKLSQRTETLLALLFVDLDGFKKVNDTLGHHAGDEVLSRVGKILQHSIRGNDVVGRIGGDEFIVLLTDISGTDGACAVAEKLIDEVSVIDLVEGAAVNINASIGCYVFVSGSQTVARDVVSQADQLMYAAKRAGGGCYRLKECLRNQQHTVTDE